MANNQEKKTVWWQPGLELFIKLSAWIVAPILVGIFIGKWLDNKYDTAPWMFLGTVVFTFLISMFGIISNALKEFQKITKTNDLKNNQKNKEKD